MIAVRRGAKAGGGERWRAVAGRCRVWEHLPAVSLCCLTVVSWGGVRSLWLVVVGFGACGWSWWRAAGVDDIEPHPGALAARTACP